ncbi:hypothetical protein E0H75_32795 [Kribbella capetownensis]|uniref:Uncharacterized protein n=1 Tax=Kribbella capetownensis TaxID=1572659 RepID=A0A4V6N4F5_9ACTN|nr:hypothetical protein [Kribbella capetownensis]TCC45272.1 hypothetical protein E0H75_32795 [Kribbella capetownensis]
MNELGTEIHLHARVFRTAGAWYADIEDELDPQPDNPLWYGSYDSQRAAIDAACARIAAMHLAQHSEQSLGLVG